MESFFDQLPQQIINGLTLGAVYALIALGYSMVYGVLQLLNFAHGDVYMVGAFVSFETMALILGDEGSTTWHPAIIIGVLMGVAMLTCGILGVVIEQFAYRPLRGSPRLAPLISALGVSFFLQNAIQLAFGAYQRSFPTGKIIDLREGFDLGNVRLSVVRLIVILTSILLMVALTYLVRRTRLGRAMRAVAIDREAAAMMGVNVEGVILATFFIGSALAGAAGVLSGLVFPRVWNTMGFTAGLKGFTAAVIGGIGNIPGAMLGGMLIGLLEAFATGYISATYKDVVVFIALVIVLLVRPTGLLGAKLPQKV